MCVSFKFFSETVRDFMILFPTEQEGGSCGAFMYVQMYCTCVPVLMNTECDVVTLAHSFRYYVVGRPGGRGREDFGRRKQLLNQYLSPRSRALTSCYY